MRVHGFCTGCRKIKRVTARTATPGGVAGLCADCRESENRARVELTVYIATGDDAPGSIPPGAAIVGRRHGRDVEIAYEPASNMASFEERLSRAADRLVGGSHIGRAVVEAHRLQAVGTFDVRLRHMTAVHDRAALSRWLATAGRG